jgi:hypothetical protein
MNKRILELAKEAGMIYGQGNLDDFDMLTYMPKEVRFAELIVKECLSVIEEMNPHDPERDIDDIFDEVDKHFGVEE